VSLAVTGLENRVGPIVSVSTASPPSRVRIASFGPVVDFGCARHGSTHKPPRLMASASGLMTGSRGAGPAPQRNGQRPRRRSPHCPPTGCAPRADAGPAYQVFFGVSGEVVRFY